MNQETSGRTWLVPALLGLVVGAAASGGPLGYYASQLQAHLAASTATVSQLNAQLVKSAAENAQLQAGNTQLEAKTQELAAERDRTRTAAEALSAQAVQLAKPDLPLQISFRRGIVAQGLVLTMRNVSQSDLPVLAQFVGHGAQSQLFRIVIPANAAKDFGGLEGWAFTAGDLVMLRNPDFREISRTVPN